MIDAEDLPDGWAVATLGEVTEPKTQQGGPSDASTTFTYIDITGVDNERKTITDPKTLPVKDAPSRARQLVRPGDVLVSMTRPNLNAVAVVPESLAGSIASTGFHVLRPKEVLPEWLFMIVRSTAFVAAMSELVQGALYPAVRPCDIRDFTIPIPPLAEQQRIVAKVEELTARSRAARAALAEVPTLLEQYRQSVLAAAFRGDLTADWREKNPNAEPASVLLDRIRAERRKQWEAKFPKKKYVAPAPVDDSDLPELPEGWCWASLPELSSAVDTLCYGVVQPGENVEGGVRLIRVCDIWDERIHTEEIRTISAETDREYSRSRVQGGELLLTVVGTIGRVAVVPPELQGSNIARAVAKLKPCSEVSAVWLAHWFSTTHMQDWLGREACEVARKTLNLKELERAVIPLAPSAEMRQLATCIPGMLEMSQTIASSLADAIIELACLDQSILAKAFRGELVPQDPADEPAAVLLERIRTGGAAVRQVQRGRVKFYVLLLLRTWKRPLSREMLERGLVLMLNPDIRKGILGRTGKPAKRGRKAASPPAFVRGLDAYFGEMVATRQLVEGPEAGFFAEADPTADFGRIPDDDLAAVKETAAAIKVIQEDKHRATDAEIVSALNGEVYELVH